MARIEQNLITLSKKLPQEYQKMSKEDVFGRKLFKNSYKICVYWIPEVARSNLYRSKTPSPESSDVKEPTICHKSRTNIYFHAWMCHIPIYHQRFPRYYHQDVINWAVQCAHIRFTSGYLKAVLPTHHLTHCPRSYPLPTTHRPTLTRWFAVSYLASVIRLLWPPREMINDN